MNGKMIGGFTVIEVPGVNKSWCGRLSTGDIYLTLAYCRVIYKIFKNIVTTGPADGENLGLATQYM